MPAGNNFPALIKKGVYMVSFKIGDNTVSKQITLEQLTAGLDKVKDKKKIDRITQIFNQYNTNTNGSSLDALDLDEQVALMNDLHKADGDGKGEDFDGKISRRGLKKAGLAGEYRAYKDFIEAYQRAVADDVNTYELSFVDDTFDGTPFTETKAVQEGETMTVEHQYNNLSGQTEKRATTITDEVGAFSTDPKGRLLRQTIDNVTIQYRGYTSDAKNAKPGIVIVSEQGVDERLTLKLQDDGTYLDEANNSHYRLDRSGIPQEFIVDDKNRITAEIWGDNQFDYTYDGENVEPATVTVNKDAENEAVYTRENDLYTSMSGDTKKYFTFDADKRQFTQTEPPAPEVPPEPPVQKQTRPRNQKYIRMTPGWKNQHVKPDEALTAQLNAMSKADEVLTELVNRNEQFKDTNLNREQLLSDLIKNNPSVFDKQGVIYTDARWNRLDFPKDLSAYKTE